MSNFAKVSIALATYNGASQLARQMDSLLAQDYPNLEVIISDDCSTDGTWDILQFYASKDVRIRLLTRDINRGYVKNFIRVFKECNGNFIAPSDQDDVWHPSKISRLVETIGEADLAYCNSRFVNKDGTPQGGSIADSARMISGNDPRNLIFCTTVCGHAMLFRRDILDAYSNLDAAPYIDWMIAFLSANRNGIKYLNEILVDWRQHQDSLSSHVRSNKIGSRAKGLKTDVQTIHALALIPGKHQSFIVDAKSKLDRWLESYFYTGMFFFVLRNGRITHRGHVARHPSLKYLVGYKLKKLIRPDYY